MSNELVGEGPGAPPRANGELVFDAPWQSRAFGLAAALADAGELKWPDFQKALIQRVETADAAGESTGTPDGYWRCWLDALGTSASASGAVDPASWSQRSTEFAAREPGHDHDHEHSHGDHDHHHHEHDHGHHHH